jgi:putative ABC transport system ATP-binding protein
MPIKSSSPPILNIQNLSKSWQSANTTLNILQNCNLIVPKGSSIAISGSSGSGKTTLLHIIAGLEQADKGNIQCCGQNLSQLDEEQRCNFRARNIGMIFQSFELIPGLNVLENISLPLRLLKRNAVEETAKHWLNTLGLHKHIHQDASQLSGGEQQRVAIARALALNPKIILADEPSGNLDQKNSSLICKILFEICAKHSTTLIVATHDLSLTPYFSEHFILEKGKLIKG